MTEYVPGALGAILAGEKLPIIKKKETPPKIKAKKNAVSQKRNKSQSTNDNDVPVKKAKITKKKDSPVKKIATKEVNSAIDDSESENEDDRSSEEPSQTYSAGVMKLKPKSVDNENIKVKREKAKQKKKELTTKRSDTADREIFVGNVTADVRRRDIEKEFKKYGAIDKVWSRSVVGMNEKKTRTLTRKFKKIGSNVLNVVNFYIRYKSAEDAVKALEMNGVLFKGLHLRVTPANKKSLSVGYSVFVSNLPFDVTEEEVHTFFQECGKIKAVRIIHDKFSGLAKGAAFVEFDDKSCVEKAIELNGKKLREREIRVAKALKRKQLAKEEANKPKKSKGKKKEEERIKEQIADFVVQKKNGTVKENNKKPKTFHKPGQKGKKFKKGNKATVKSIMT